MRRHSAQLIPSSVLMDIFSLRGEQPFLTEYQFEPRSREFESNHPLLHFVAVSCIIFHILAI